MTCKILLSSAPEEPVWYKEALEAAGAEAAGGYCPAPDLSCDGLVLCGGGDIDPARFHQENRGSDPPDLKRDEAEFLLCEQFIRAGKPILGICRGMQVLNVALGGDIIQDLPPLSAPFHGGNGRYQSHAVRAEEGSLFADLYGKIFLVNSFHHQAVGELGAGLIPQVWAESGIVEGFVHGSLPILGTQFHPERMTGNKYRPETVDGKFIFQKFLELCKMK